MTRIILAAAAMTLALGAMPAMAQTSDPGFQAMQQAEHDYCKTAAAASCEIYQGRLMQAWSQCRAIGLTLPVTISAYRNYRSAGYNESQALEFSAPRLPPELKDLIVNAPADADPIRVGQQVELECTKNAAESLSH